jgi:tRNA pseudouridine-54 N-methylase
MREAIAYLAGVPEDDVAIRLVVDGLPPQVATATADRAQARTAAARARASSEAAVRALTGAGMTTREVATVLGVSHQRVAQLLQAA